MENSKFEIRNSKYDWRIFSDATCAGLSVLIPLPIAANDHQRWNASRLAQEGAALMLAQSDLTPDGLAKVLLTLLRNESCQARMRAASRRLGRPAAARNVVKRIVGLLREEAAQRPGSPVGASTVQGG